MKYTLNNIVSSLRKNHTRVSSSTSYAKDEKTGKMREYIDHQVEVPGKFSIIMRDEVNYSGKRSHKDFAVESSGGYDSTKMYIKLHNKKDHIIVHKEGSPNIYNVHTDGDYVMMSPGFSKRVMSESEVFPRFVNNRHNMENVCAAKPILMNAKKKKAAAVKESADKKAKTPAKKKKN